MANVLSSRAQFHKAFTTIVISARLEPFTISFVDWTLCKNALDQLSQDHFTCSVCVFILKKLTNPSTLSYKKSTLVRTAGVIKEAVLVPVTQSYKFSNSPLSYLSSPIDLILSQNFSFFNILLFFQKKIYFKLNSVWKKHNKKVPTATS